MTQPQAGVRPVDSEILTYHHRSLTPLHTHKSHGILVALMASARGGYSIFRFAKR